MIPSPGVSRTLRETITASQTGCTCTCIDYTTALSSIHTADYDVLSHQRRRCEVDFSFSRCSSASEIILFRNLVKPSEILRTLAYRHQNHNRTHKNPF